ncbi:11586_t:CDS:2, partial [Gigaspora margarita]
KKNGKEQKQLDDLKKDVEQLKRGQKPTLKSADDEPPKFNSDGDQTIEKPETQDQPTYQLPSDISIPDSTSSLKTYETTFEPTTTPLS